MIFGLIFKLDSIKKNAPQIFEIRQAISNLSQGTNSISAYYTTLKAYLDELESYRTLLACACGVVPNFNAIYDTNHLMDFLQGLNDSYAYVKSQVLLMDPLPRCQKHTLYFHRKNVSVL